MKKYIIVFITLFFLTNYFSISSDNYPFSAGVRIAAKAGINANSSVPQGIQNHVDFLKGIDAALTGYLPISDENRTGVFVELGYTNIPFGIKYFGTNRTGSINQKFFTVSPLLLVSVFTVGLDFGFNLKTAATDVAPGLIPLDDDISVNIRVGAMYPIYENQVGSLNIVANATYGLTGSSYWNSHYTYHPTTLSLGFSYLFNLESE